MTQLITVAEAKYEDDYRIRLRFSDGTEKTVDFSPWLSGEVFRPLRDQRAFRRFFVSGGTVCWPNGADVAPETLYVAPDASESAALRSSPQRSGRSG